MSYGEIKIDTITFTAGGVDTSIAVSGLVQNPTFTGNITTTGTITADVVKGTTTVSGATVTGTAGVFTVITGGTAGFTTVTGTTVTGTTANFVTVSGTTVTGSIGKFTNVTGVNIVGTTLVSGATVTGNIGSFTTLTGGTVNLTSGVFASGTAAAPSVSIGTTDNGLYSPGADQVAISTNGTGRLFINSSGQVGVGTSSPSAALDVVTSTGNTFIRAARNSQSTGQVALALAGGTSGTDWLLYQPTSSNDFRIFGNSSDRVTVTSAGNVGVGTTSPTYLCNVLAASGSQNIFQAGQTGVSNGYTITSNGTNLTHAWFNGGSEAVRIDSSGRLGIGSSSPGRNLEISSSISDTRIAITNSTTGGGAAKGLELVQSGVDGYVFGYGTGDLIFGVNSAERVRITNTGRLGIGSTSPNSVLQVNSGANLGGILVGFNSGSSNFYDADLQVFRTGNGTERARIDSSGRLLVGTSTSVSQFGVQPQIQSTGTSGAGGYLGLTVFNTAADSASNLVLGHSKGGSVGTYTASVANDLMGEVTFTAANGTDMRRGASIGGYADGAWGTNDHPGRLVFSTTADGASSPTERMRIDSSGRVGIGTTSPGSPLTVEQSSANINLELHSTSSGRGTQIKTHNDHATFYHGLSGDTSGNFIYYTADAKDHVFSTNNTERARIDSSGRLLVGTSSSLTGTDTQYSRLVVAGNTSGASAGIMSISRPEAATSITTDEVLGIISFADSGAGEYGRITCAADANAGTNDYPGRLVFSTTADGAASPTERMRITQNGLFQFGTYSTPAGVHEFNWQGAHRMSFNNKDATAANCYGLVLNYTSAAPNGTGNEFIYCQDNVGARFLARSNGGLANYSANNANLSDRNAKKDISPAAGTWDCIKEWEIVNYRYKDQPDDADLNLGVIAQQVAESCPEVITVFEEAKDDQPEKLGIKEQQMYWMAIKALQEAQVRIEALEAKVAALESA